jgi:hypothetical protein
MIDMLLLTKQTKTGILNVVKVMLLKLKISLLYVYLESHNLIKHPNLSMIDSQFSLFLPSFFFITIDEWESPTTNHIPNFKLPVELSVNKSLSACRVCPRLTHLFLAGHFVTSSTLCKNKSITSSFIVAHIYIGVDYFVYELCLEP